MRSPSRFLQYLFPAVLLAGCELETDTEPQPFFERQDLVSDQPGVAPFTDPALVNPWGIVFGENDELWVANAGTGAVTVYDENGRRMLDYPVILTDEPITGIAVNLGEGLAVENPDNMAMVRTELVMASLAGNVVGFTERLRALTAIAFTDDEAVYTGIALTENRDGRQRVLLADFANRELVELDQNFERVGTWEDPFLPTGYAPFNVQRIGGRIYVAYAVVGASGRSQHGIGLGIISEFSLDGTFTRRIAAGGFLNAPWGMARAPSDFGQFGDQLLVGNFGDGRIVAIDLDSTRQTGLLTGANLAPIVIPGLWGIAFHNNALYFAAGIGNEQHGLLGRIVER